MNCAWDAYINLIPKRFRDQVDKLGRENLLEVRLRLGRPPELVLRKESIFLKETVLQDDINFSVNIASRYSPWTATSVSYGYITAQGGHRVGICGEVNTHEGKIISLRSATSISLRVARDYPGISGNLKNLKESTLIIGSPGSGKTTLLRDYIRQISESGTGAIAVVDERQEIFPMAGDTFCFAPGMRTDVLSGCMKKSGIEIVLRTMTPQIIAVDEITAQEDCTALLHAAWCGVTLLATAHAASRLDLERRTIYRTLLEQKLFENLVILHSDKSWLLERMEV